MRRAAGGRWDIASLPGHNVREMPWRGKEEEYGHAVACIVFLTVDYPSLSQRHAPQVVDALVKAPGDKKADLNARAATGDGALHWACWHGDVSTVWLLLAHGAM